MGWVSIDDGFFLHRKVEGRSKDAKLLFLAALAYCNRERTDGFISTTGLRTAAAMVDVKPAVARQLVDVDLWETVDGGYVVHDYEEYQLTSAKVEERRRVRAAAGRMGGLRSGRSRQAFAEANASANALPSASAHAPPNGQAKSNPSPSPQNHSSRLPVTHDPDRPANGTAPGGAGEEKVAGQNPDDPLVERVVAVVGESPRARRDAVSLVATARSVLDPTHIDEAIGRCEGADLKPRSVAFFETTMARTASHYGLAWPGA